MSRTRDSIPCISLLFIWLAWLGGSKDNQSPPVQTEGLTIRLNCGAARSLAGRARRGQASDVAVDLPSSMRR